jgi:hypothetical protein
MWLILLLLLGPLAVLGIGGWLIWKAFKGNN